MLAILHDFVDDKSGFFTRSFAYYDNDTEQQEACFKGSNEEEQPEATIVEYVEDEELIMQMKALGLPVAFGSNLLAEEPVDEQQPTCSTVPRKKSRKRNRQTLPGAFDFVSLPSYLQSLTEERCNEIWSSWSDKFPQFSSETDRAVLFSFQPSSKPSSVDEDWLNHCNSFAMMASNSDQEVCANKSEFISQRLQLLGCRYDALNADRYSLRLGQKLSKIKKDRAQLDLWRSNRSDVDEERVGTKYEAQKYRLFSRFDEGIQLDEESWFSVTPEKIAQHHASRCQCDVAVDAFCGAGGDAIQLAFTCELVIAIDIDPHKIELARHNAAIYGIQDRIEFICGDFFTTAPLLKADIVYLSPPWGGPQYSSTKRFDLFTMLPVDVKKMFETARQISRNLAFFAPRNVDVMQLVSLAENSSADDSFVEIEQNFFGNRFKAITAYYGEIVDWEKAQKAVKLKNSLPKNKQVVDDDEAFSEFMFAKSEDLPIFQH